MLTRNKTYIDAIADIRQLCAGSRRAADGSAVVHAGSLSLDEYMPSLCLEGFAGPLCSVCAPGWGRIHHTGCTKCLHRGTNTAAYGLIVLLNALSLALTIRSTISKGRSGGGGGASGARPAFFSQIIKARDISGFLSRRHHSTANNWRQPPVLVVGVGATHHYLSLVLLFPPLRLMLNRCLSATPWCALWLLVYQSSGPRRSKRSSKRWTPLRSRRRCSRWTAGERPRDAAVALSLTALALTWWCSLELPTLPAPVFTDAATRIVSL